MQNFRAIKDSGEAETFFKGELLARRKSDLRENIWFDSQLIYSIVKGHNCRWVSIWFVLMCFCALPVLFYQTTNCVSFLTISALLLAEVVGLMVTVFCLKRVRIEDSSVWESDYVRAEAVGVLATMLIVLLSGVVISVFAIRVAISTWDTQATPSNIYHIFPSIILLLTLPILAFFVHETRAIHHSSKDISKDDEERNPLTFGRSDNPIHIKEFHPSQVQMTKLETASPEHQRSFNRKWRNLMFNPLFLVSQVVLSVVLYQYPQLHFMDQLMCVVFWIYFEYVCLNVLRVMLLFLLNKSEVEELQTLMWSVRALNVGNKVQQGRVWRISLDKKVISARILCADNLALVRKTAELWAFDNGFSSWNFEVVPVS